MLLQTFKPGLRATHLGFMRDGFKSTERFDFAHTPELCVCLLLWSSSASRYDASEKFQTRSKFSQPMYAAPSYNYKNTSETTKASNDVVLSYGAVRFGAL